MFEGCEWKGRRIWVCQSGMAMWTSLNYVSSKYHSTGGDGWGTRRTPTRAEQMDTIRAYPGDTRGCRCRDCRYKRISSKL